MELSKSVRGALLVGALIIAATLSLQMLMRSLPDTGPTDFMMYWLVGRSADPYALRVIPFVNPPTALLLVKALGLLPFAPAFFVWTAASVGLFMWGAARHAGIGVASLSLLPRPTVQSLYMGQISTLLSGLALLAFSIPGFAGGLLLGVVAAMKPQLVLLAPLALLVRRDWPMLGGMAAGSASIAAVSLLIWPEAWSAWIGSLPRLREALDNLGIESFVITPAGRADSLGLPFLPFYVMSIGVALAAVCTFARRLEGLYLAGLVIAASLLASPYGLLHDLTALMPVAIVMILRGNWLVAMAGAALLCTGFAAAPYLLGGGMLALVAWRISQFHFPMKVRRAALGQSA